MHGLEPMIPIVFALAFSAECPRIPVPRVRESSRTLSPADARDVQAMQRAVAAAYPGYELILGDSLYVTTEGKAYRVDAHFERDDANNYSALVFSFSSAQTAAVKEGFESHSRSCRAPVELVFFKENGDVFQVIGRGQLDAEAVSVDIRTMELDYEDGGPVASFLYFAYFTDKDWFGFVGFNAGMWMDKGKLTGARIPRSYLKVTRPANTKMEGYLAAAGGDPDRGIAHLQVAAFGTSGEINKEIDVPIVDGRWLSGAQMLQRLP